MEQRTWKQNGLGLGALLLWCAGAAACQSSQAPTGQSSRALTATCVAQDETLPADAWICPETRSVQCTDGTGTAAPPTLYVRDPADAGSCQGQELAVEVDALGVGEHDVSVRDPSGALLCETQLTVTDHEAPVLTPKPQLYLWPPNHKFHTIKVSDCFTIEDACQGELSGEFIWASSDEPVDSIGDGHHAPDIQIDACGALALRAERQGPKDGRVYKLGVRVVDAAGNASEGECAVIVDHDQRGVDGADSGESYRVTFDGTQGFPTCDGVTPPPPTQEPPTQEPPTQEPPTQEPPTQEPPTTDPPSTDPPAGPIG